MDIPALGTKGLNSENNEAFDDKHEKFIFNIRTDHLYCKLQHVYLFFMLQLMINYGYIK
jgi:hypothetical protein